MTATVIDHPRLADACDRIIAAERAQAIADKRAAAGLISADGVTHRTAEAMALYVAGCSPHSREYLQASFK